MSAQAAMTSVPPKSFGIFGRHAQLENGDICGQYSLLTKHVGHPAYQNSMSNLVVRFYRDRWVIDRGALRDSPVCMAYAPQIPNCSHPACPDLVWHVWDSQQQTHVVDPKVYAIDAPKELTFVGRGHDKENAVMNGTYVFYGLAHGRAFYRQKGETDAAIIYSPQMLRWMITGAGDVGTNNCCAFADSAGSTLHPGDPSLHWQFYEAEKGDFVLDPGAGLVNAPEIVNVLGRHAQAENCHINGAYHLVGVQSGKPLYNQLGTSAIIRYSPTKDLWLIDTDGFAKPSLGSRLYEWVTQGSGDLSNRCSAFASARNTDHPGHLDLEWHVWESAASLHTLDKAVAVTAAPMVMRLSGREGHVINGDYHFLGGHQGRAAYRKAGSPVSIYFGRGGRWIVDQNGMLDNDVVAAYSDPDSCCDYPTAHVRTWHVHEASRQAFVSDPAMTISFPNDILWNPDADKYVPREDEGGLPAQPCRGRKRGYAMEADFVSVPHSPHPKLARTGNHQGGSSFLGSLFGA